MTPEQLKASILQYAIQGKLTQQTASENAQDLICSLKEKKAELVKKKAIKSEKPLANTNEEVPFDIPDNWEWCHCQDIFFAHSAMRIHQSDWKPEGIPFFRGRELVRLAKTGDPNAEIYITEEFYNELKEKGGVPKKDDILITAVGTLGKVYVVQGTKRFYYKDAYILCLDNYGVDPYYIKYFVESPYSQNYIYGDDAYGTTVAQLTLEKLKKMLIPVPPLEEQHRIVTKIEELLPYVDRYAEAYEKLEQFNAKFPEDMKKSILQYAIQGKLVGQRPEEGTAEELYQKIQAEKQKLIKEGKIKKDKPFSEITEDEIPFDIPESWKWVRLGQIINFQGGYAFKSTSYVQSSENQVIRLGNVKNNNLLIHEKEVFVDDALAEMASDYKLKEDDILVTMTGTRRKKDYFFTLIVRKEDIKDRNLYLNQRVGCFRAMSGVDVEYLLAVLHNEAIKNIIFLKETGTANQGNLGSEDMKEFVYIPLPPLNEQHRIVEKLKELLPCCDRLVK